MVRCLEPRGCSSAWLERLPVKEEVAGSSPVSPAGHHLCLEWRSFVTMFKELQKRFASTDSYVSLVLGIAVVLVVGVLLYNFVQNRGTAKPAGEVATTDEQKLASGSPGGTHTVTAGETLWGISEKYYKTGYNWVDLASANNLTDADAIEVGQQLVIPTVTPIQPQGQLSSGETTVQPASKSYTVVAGDSLWKIAVAQYGNGYKWPEIARANSLGNPDLIHAGNVLTLP